MPRKVEISYRTITFTTIFIICLWFLFQIRQIILGLFIAVIVVSALNPSVRKLESLKFPRWLAILIIYLGGFLFLGLGLAGIIPPLVDQTSTLINQIPEFFRQFKIMGIDEKLIASQFAQLTAVPSNMIKFLIGVFSNIVQIVALAVFTFYLLLERKNLDHYLAVLVGEEKGKEIEKVLNKVENRMGGWIRGELLLMTIVGILNYIGFRIIGIEFALPLAILAFLFEIIPNIGPTIAAFPAIIIGLTVSPFYALAAAGWCFLVQQLENTIFVPRIMKKVAGVNPLVSILSLAVGFKLAGVGGAMLAIPTFLTLQVVLGEVFTSKKFREV